MKRIMTLGIIVASSLLIGCKKSNEEENIDVKELSNDQTLAFGLYAMSNQINTSNVTTFSRDNKDTKFEDDLEKLQPFYEMYENFLNKSNELIEGIEKDINLEDFDINEEYDRSYKFTVDGIVYLAAFNVTEFIDHQTDNVDGILIVEEQEFNLGGQLQETEDKTNIKLIATNEFNNNITFSIHQHDNKLVYRFESTIDGVRNVSYTRIGEMNNKRVVEVFIGEKLLTASYFRFTERTKENNKLITTMIYRINGTGGSVIIIEDTETGDIKFRISETGKGLKEVASKVKHRFRNK